MKDTYNALFQAYYEAIQTAGYPVYEGEEPDDVKDKIYAVLQVPNMVEASTSNSSDQSVTIQVSVHSWEYKYNNSKSLNNAVNDIYQAIKPLSNSVLDLSDFGLQMMNLGVQQDRIENYGEIGGKVFISRILIFKQDIFIIN